MKWLYCALVGLCIAAQPLLAGVEGYRVTRDVTPGNYTPITGTPIEIQTGSISNGLSKDVPIGFTFVYDGIAYDSLKLSTNGYLILGTNATANTSVNDLDGGTTSNLHKPVLAPMWDPWSLASVDSLTYQSDGSVFIANWKNVIHLSGLGGTQNFQVKLYLDGRIEFIYGNTNPHTSHSYSLGINDPIGGSRHFLSLQTVGTGNFSSTVANDTLNNPPSLDERFTFTPPTPLSVSSINVPSASYPTLKMVFDTLRTYGISQAVDINITGDVTETAVVDIDYVPGSYSYPLTIQLAGSVTAARISGSIAGSPLLRLRGMKNLTIDGAGPSGRGMTIENTSTSGLAAIQMIEGTQFCTVKNAILKTNHPSGTTTGSAVLWIGDGNYCSQLTRRGILGTSSYNTVEDCEITGGTSGRPTTGVLVYATNSHKDSNNIISGNLLYDFGGSGTSIAGIRLTGGSFGTVLTGNDIYMISAAASATTVNGIRVEPTSPDSVVYTRIEGNTIRDLSTSAAGTATISGIVQNGTLTVGNRIVNNFINLAPGTFGGANSTLRGISHQGGQLFVYFNTVRIAGSGTTDTSFAFIRTTAGTLNLRNNIFYNGRSSSGRPQYAIVLNSATGLTINYNDYRADGTNGSLGRIAGTTHATLASWKTGTGQDGLSISETPNFMSSSDLHVNPLIFSGIASGGTPISGFTTDVDGDTRHATKPDIGADEFNSAPYVTAALPDTTLNEDFPRVFLRKLTDHFSDQDNTTLTYGASALTAGVTPTVSNDSLYLFSVANFFGASQIRVTSFDGSNTAADTLLVTVNGVPDDPIVVAPMRDTTLAEDFGRAFVAKVSDVFDDPDGNPLSYTSDTLQAGLATLISNDSLYVLSTPEFSGTVGVRATANNGSASVSDTLVVTVISVNDPPVLTAAFTDTTFAEDFGRRFVVFLPPHFSDVDNVNLSYSVSALATGLTAQVSGDSLYIQSVAEYNGSVGVRVSASDGSATVADTFAVLVTAVNDIPTADNLSTSTSEDQPVATVLSANDVDGDTLTFQVMAGPAQGSLSGVAPNLTYTPSLNYSGQDTFTYRAYDGAEYSPIATGVIAVLPVNDAPVVAASLRDTSFVEDFGHLFVRRLTNVFADVDNGSLSYSAQVLSAGLTASISNDSLYIGSTVNFNGGISVRVSASDGSLSVADTFVVTVTPVNDGPYVLSAQSDLNRPEDFGTSYVGRMTDIFDDVDNVTLIFTAVNLSAGVVPFISNDSLYIASSVNFTGTVSVALSASDGSLSAADTFTVTVTPQNDAPFVVAALRDTTWGEDFGRVMVRRLTEVFFDIDNVSLGYSATALGAGVLTDVGGDTLYLTSELNFFGDVLVRVSASDGSLSVADTFVVTVTPVNDAPVVLTPHPDVVRSEDFGRSFIGRMTDVFGDVDNTVLSYSSAALGAGVTPSISNDSLYLTSSPDFVGSVDIRIEGSDGILAIADTFVVTVTSQNDAPVVLAPLRDTLFVEDFPRTFVRRLTEVFSDVDSGPLNFGVSTSQGLGADISGDSLFAAGSAQYHGLVSVVVTADDGNLSVTDTFLVTVTPVNDAPTGLVLLEPADGDSLPNITDPVGFRWLGATDIDGDVLSYSLSVHHALFDTIVSDIMDTLYTFDLGTRLMSASEYSWSVRVSDGHVTVSSDTFQFRTPVVVGISNSSGGPRKMALHQNYPNPFNPSTTIRYDLVDPTRVVLTIYNMLGQRVRTLVDGMQSAGFKTVVWDGRNDVGQQVSAGLYIYRMHTSQFVKSRKMLLVK